MPTGVAPGCFLTPAAKSTRFHWDRPILQVNDNAKSHFSLRHTPKHSVLQPLSILYPK